jgi:hypothetical protein
MNHTNVTNAFENEQEVRDNETFINWKQQFGQTGKRITHPNRWKDNARHLDVGNRLGAISAHFVECRRIKTPEN